MLSNLVFTSFLALLPLVFGDPQCDCYLTDGSSPTYFTSHGFWDFRSLSQYVSSPAVIDSVDGNANSPTTSAFFDWGTPLRDFWAPQQYKNGDTAFPMVKTFNNLYIQANGGSNTYLRMRSTRLPGFQTAAELQSNEMLDHASIRMYSRITGSTGACGSVFTYLHSENPADVQESDIEMLTKGDHNLVHYTNQPGVLNGEPVPGATHEINLPGGKQWSDWTTHRLDWTPGKTTFYADGQQVLVSDFQVPRDKSYVLLNMWSDGGSWTGSMPQGGEATMDVQWVEILHGVTNKERCRNVCSVDLSGEVGKAVLV
ncbi:xylanase [Pochonia chlamydosporia 170]|uniref:Xylanase n=1 Tax=Pochonia chlamydosporia 170 TaxID=1380566 RepID=A0A179F3A4_METCM|nr:xylanase [Pochonia chlamydosporia 170]OAQ59885.1 xylanase [Pochonia chlamydosporia 170]